MPESFEELVSKIPAEQQAEFFRTLHEAGIDPRDRVLVRFLRALQLYKGFYETIPVSVQKVAAEIEELARHAEQSADAGEQLLGQLTQESAQIGEAIGHLQSRIEAAVHKASESVASRMVAALQEAADKTLPVADLAAAGKTFSDAVAASVQATDALRKNIRIIRRAHVLTCLLIVAALTAVFWWYLHLQYKKYIEATQIAVAAQFEENRDVLLQLAKSRRSLELISDTKKPGRKMLFMKNATGWTTVQKQGVIEFKE